MFFSLVLLTFPLWKDYGPGYDCYGPKVCAEGTKKESSDCAEGENCCIPKKCKDYGSGFNCLESELCVSWLMPSSDCVKEGYECCEYKKCSEWGSEYKCRLSTDFCAGRVYGEQSSDCGAGVCCRPSICESDILPGGVKCRDIRVCGSVVLQETDCGSLGLECCEPSQECADYAGMDPNYACRDKSDCHPDHIVTPSDCEDPLVPDYKCCLPKE